MCNDMGATLDHARMFSAAKLETYYPIIKQYGLLQLLLYVFFMCFIFTFF